jgi:hypothetical protein
MANNTITSRENLITSARMTHNNQIIDIAEVLNETNDILADAPLERANDITSHVVGRRTALPQPVWVKIGNGWSATTAPLQDAREQIGILHDRYQCPQDLMDIQPDKAKYRRQQENPHIEALGQTVANCIFSGNSATAPEQFDGLSQRYTSVSSNRATFVVDNGDTGQSDDTSIWFIQWGPGKAYLIYPRNSETVGLQKEDKGLQLVTGDDSNQLWAYMTEFSWKVGMCIEDTRCVKRLCDIDSVLGQTYNVNEDYIIQIRNNFNTPGTIYMYCNENVFNQFCILAKDKRNVRWSENNPFGKPIMYFWDMPIRRCDAIGNAETSLA